MTSFSFFARHLRRGALAAALLIPALADAQTFEWAQGRAYTFSANPALVRSAAGAQQGGGGWWASLEQHRLAYGADMLGSLRFTRLRADGSTAIQRVAEGVASVMQVQAAPDGSALLLGQYLDSLVFDNRQRFINPHVGSGVVFFVARLDSLGELRWLRPLRPEHGPIDVQSASALVLDPRGGSVWAGYDVFSDSYATRFDVATGDSLSSIIQREVSHITSIAVAPDGTTYLAGGCAGTIANYNGTAVPLPVGLTYNTYVACYRPDGRNRWVRHIEDITCPNTYVATADTTGVYFAGDLYGPWQFGSFQATTSAFNSGAFFLTRLSRDTGNFEWLRESPAASAPNAASLASTQPLAADAAGNAWLLANTTGTLAWPGFGPLTTPLGGAATVVAYDPNGTLRGLQVAGGRASIGHGLAFDVSTRKALLTGSAPDGGVELAPLAALPIVSGTETQLFVASFRATFATLPPLGLPAAAPPAVSAYPNPVAPNRRVQLEGRALTEATLVDALGRVVARYALGGTAASAITAPPRTGLYLLRLREADGSRTAQRLIVE